MKKLSIFLAGLLTVCLTGCASVQTSAFAGSYWLENYSNKTAPDGFYEKIEYEVKTETETNYAPALIKSGNIKFEIDSVKSSYYTELYTENGNYVYQTSLTVNGTYYYGANGEKSYKVENDTTVTKTVFKDFENKFKVISSTKEASNIFPVYSSPSSEKDFKKVAYKSVIEYGEKNATVTLTTDDPISKEYFSTLSKPVTVKKYNKKEKGYIDNEIIPLIFRTFKYDSSLSYTFKSIENVTGSLKQVVGKAVDLNTSTPSSESASQSPIFPMTVNNCSLNGVRFDVEFDVLGVSFQTTGEYGQTFLTAYYETARKNVDLKTKHFMVKGYQPMIYNCAYMVYTIHTVYNQRETA